MGQKPYIEKTRTVTERFYNPGYGDARICECGHTYYRHFDSYEDMSPVGCKYCFCFEFKEFAGDIDQVIEYVKKTNPEYYQDLIKTQSENKFSESWLHERCIEFRYDRMRRERESDA